MSPALARMSSTVCRVSARLSYAASRDCLGSRFCQICVGRCAPDPHLGALRAVEGPIMAIICAGSGDLMGVSHMNPILPVCVVARCLMRRSICWSEAWAGCSFPRCVRGRCCGSIGGLVMMMSTPAGKACVNSAGVMVLTSMGRRVSHPSVDSRGVGGGAGCAAGRVCVFWRCVRLGRCLSKYTKPLRGLLLVSFPLMWRCRHRVPQDVGVAVVGRI